MGVQLTAYKVTAHQKIVSEEQERNGKKRREEKGMNRSRRKIL